MLKKWMVLLLAALIALSVSGALAQQEWDSSKVIYEEGSVATTEGEKEAGNPIFLITMTDGSMIRGELYPMLAPQAVGNFIALANSGFYDGLIFHRVIPGFVIQGGCPLGNGTGNPGWRIKGEFAANQIANDLSHTKGVLSMARGAQLLDSAGSQFFIMAADYPSLDGQYAAFGKVLEGEDVVDRVVSVPRNQRDKPDEDQVMKTVRVETFGKEYPFEKLQ